jgi:hypothetical protein
MLAEQAQFIDQRMKECRGSRLRMAEDALDVFSIKRPASSVELCNDDPPRGTPRQPGKPAAESPFADEVVSVLARRCGAKQGHSCRQLGG